MKQFQFTVQDPLGIHARPAGLLAKLAKGYSDTVITITKDGNTVKAWNVCSPPWRSEAVPPSVL